MATWVHASGTIDYCASDTEGKIHIKLGVFHLVLVTDPIDGDWKTQYFKTSSGKKVTVNQEESNDQALGDKILKPL